MAAMSKPEAEPRGFPPSRGPEISARDIPGEERVLEHILGSLDERRARFDDEVTAEITAAIERLGKDWGRPEYQAEFDDVRRADLLDSALASSSARSVVAAYVAHLQEHRAEFLSQVPLFGYQPEPDE